MLSKNLFVFPTSRAIRDYISLKKQENQLLNKTLAVGDFFSKVIVPTHNKVYIDNDLRIILLQNAIAQIDTKTLGIDKSFTKLFKSSEYIFKFFSELAQEGKSIDDINSYDIYEFYEDHLKILKKIYVNYTQQLEAHNYVDNITIANNYEINSEFLVYFDGIMFFYEGYFSNFEFEVIQKVALHTKLLIHLQINEFNTKNIELFNSLGYELEVDKNYVLNLSDKDILEENATLQSKVNNTIYPVSQRIEQIGVIKKAITDMVQKGIEPDKIVVILPDEKFAPYLKLMDKENYFNFAMGNSIYKSNFFKTIKIINEYFTNDEPKYEQKVIYEQIDIELINNIKETWSKTVNQEVFFDIYNQVLETEQNIELKEKLLELKISLDTLLFHQNLQRNEISLKDSFKILLQKLSAITLDDVRSGKITVIGILESRFASFDGVIIIDFNDDKVPKRSVKDKFLSTKVKVQVGLPSSKDRQNLQKYYYKRIIESSKELVMSYVDNEENSMSRFVSELFSAPNIVKKEFSHILHNTIEHKKIDDKIEVDIDLSKQSWSASALKNYLTCKRKYYYNNILKLREHEILLEPKPYELGNVIHDVLEKVIGQNPTNFSLDDIKSMVTKYQNINPYLTFDLELWKIRLNKFYTNELELRKAGFTPVYFEKPFNINYNGINLIGRIDRLDKDSNANYAIYDYKTSKTLKVDSVKTYEDAKDFQLEFYYLACREFTVESVGYYDLYQGKVRPEIMLEQKLELLDKILADLKTTKVSFDKCEENTPCQMCAYKSICNR